MKKLTHSNFRESDNPEIMKLMSDVKNKVHTCNFDLNPELKQLEQKLNPVDFVLYLQSAVYFVTYKRSLSTEHEAKFVHLLLNEIKEYNDIPAWVDEKEGVNIFHAIARSKSQDSNNLKLALDIFSDYKELLLQTDKFGYTPLNAACKDGHFRLAMEFINQKPHFSDHEYTQMLQQKNADGFSPFITAAGVEGGDAILKIIQQETDLDINDVNNFGNTALHIAFRQGQYDNAKWLLRQKNVDPNLVTKNKNTLWTQAAFHKLGYKLFPLIADNRAINRKNEEGNNPLIIACRNGHVKNVIYLLKNNADYLALNNYGDSALTCAFLKDHADCFAELVECSWAENQLYKLVNRSFEEGWKFLLYDICSTNKNQFLEELLPKMKLLSPLLISDALTKKHQKDSINLLEIACTNENWDIVDMILELAFSLHSQTQQAKATHMNASPRHLNLNKIEDLIEYTRPLFLSNDSRNVVNVAYHAKNINNRDAYKQFMYQKDSKSQITVIEKWNERNPAIAHKLNKYINEYALPKQQSGFFARKENNDPFAAESYKKPQHN